MLILFKVLWYIFYIMQYLKRYIFHIVLLSNFMPDMV